MTKLLISGQYLSAFFILVTTFRRLNSCLRPQVNALVMPNRPYLRAYNAESVNNCTDITIAINV
jgi:hypothetical protein